MSLRRVGTLVAALALTACHSVTQEAQPAELVFASFNSATGAIPLPNDLLLQIYTPPTAQPTATVPQAQIEVLRGYARSGGFPSDVEAAITLPFNTITWNGTAYVPGPAPTLDAGTVTPQTVVLLRWDTAGGTTTATTPETVAYEAVITPGKLTLRPLPASATDPARRWKGGRYVVAVRGGPNGVLAGGKVVNADSGVALAIQNKDMSIKENQPPGFTAAQAAQVNGLRTVLWSAFEWSAAANGAWSPAPSDKVTAAFEAVDAKFPYRETATIATFAIDNSAHVKLDSAAGQVPFPSDFLLERNVANCPTGVAPCIINSASFGSAAAGLRTLDGFSTTAMLLAPLTGTIDASTVNWSNVHVFEMPKPPAVFPTRLKDLSGTSGALPSGAGAAYVSQPTGSFQRVEVAPGVFKDFTTTMVLAPAVHADLSGLGLGKYAVPPLKEKTTYAVVVTNRVKNADGTPMTRGAVANILLSTTAPLYTVIGGAPVSLISGPDGATAASLQALRDGLAPLLNNLGALTGNATTKSDVVMVYTVTTQTVTAPLTAVQAFAAGAHPLGAPTLLTRAEVAAAYGVDEATTFASPSAVFEFAEVTFNTMNLLLSGRTGGMFDTGQPTPEPITALVALPDPALVTKDCGAAFAGKKCAPLVVFRHGIPRAKGDMIPIAEALAAKGFVVAAIDAEKFGDRTYCGAATQAAADQQCLALGGPASTCVADPKLKTPVDAGVVGRCSNGLLRKRVDCAVFDPATCISPKGIPLATGNFFVTLNFFRTRDSLRQDVIDQAALVNALAPVAAPAVGDDLFFDHLALNNLAVDPDEVYFASLSLGSANSTLSVAANPRFKRGAFHAGFATIVDDYSNPQSSDFAALVALLGTSTPPVAPGTPEFTQLLQVAKWILDPADPANFAPIIAGSGKPVLHQIGVCDPRIPNTQSRYFSELLGLGVSSPAFGPQLPEPGDGGTSYVQWFIDAASGVPACDVAQVDHGFLIDPTAHPTLTSSAQASFADFLATGAAQPTTVRP